MHACTITWRDLFFFFFLHFVSVGLSICAGRIVASFGCLDEVACLALNALLVGCHCCWIAARDKDVAGQLATQVAVKEACGTFHVV
jgi:hypothetical protein